MARKRKKKIDPKRAARRLPEFMQDIAFSKRVRKPWRKPQSFGAAGPCRRIDPKTGEVIEVMDG